MARVVEQAHGLTSLAEELQVALERFRTLRNAESAAARPRIETGEAAK